jgi:hypothetical protein
MDSGTSITSRARIRRRTAVMLGNIEIRFIIRRGLQIKIYLIPLSCSYGLRVGRSDIRLWMTASSQFSQDSYVPAKPAKQTTAIIIMGIMTVIIITVVVEIITKKLLITRLCKILKYRRVKLKNNG